MGQQGGVFAAQRFALGAIADDDSPVPGNRRHLAAGWESRTAASRQPGRVDGRDEFSCHRRHFAELRHMIGQAGTCSGQQPRHARHESEYSVKVARSRHTTTTATIITQHPANAWNQTRPVSVPLPRLCASAIGHNR